MSFNKEKALVGASSGHCETSRRSVNSSSGDVGGHLALQAHVDAGRDPDSAGRAAADPRPRLAREVLRADLRPRLVRQTLGLVARHLR